MNIRRHIQDAIWTAIIRFPWANQDKSKLAKAINKSYPFGKKEGYAYKVWLEERKRVLQVLGIPPEISNVKPKKPKKSKHKPVKGQLSLF